MPRGTTCVSLAAHSARTAQWAMRLLMVTEGGRRCSVPTSLGVFAGDSRVGSARAAGASFHWPSSLGAPGACVLFPITVVHGAMLLGDL